MNRAAICVLAVATSVGVLNLACSKQEEAATETKEPEKEYVAFGEYVSLEDTLPRVRYFEDGLVSINDRCAVRKVKLNPKMPAVYVNGQPVGFC
jgi:hypothetical protein